MTKKQKKNLYRIIISAAVFLFGIILPVNDIIKKVIFFAVYIFIGYDVLIKAFKNLRRIYSLDEHFLMAIATVGALFINEFPEAVFVMLFYKTGELFESIAVGKSRKSISSLMDLRPDYANISRDGKIIKVSPEEIKKGEIIIVEPGERIPLDGIITKGSTSLNLAALTGESMPLLATVGDSVMSGSININGVIEVRSEKEFYDSAVNKILELVENSAANKSKSEAFITRFAKYYTPAVVVSAIVLAVFIPLILGNFSMWLERALIFLVVSCPCALVISVPLSFFAGIGKASKNGILIKGSNYLEALSNAKTVVFDKTGTLTYGDFFVDGVYPQNISRDELIELAAKCEFFSNHPISVSLKKEYGKEISKDEILNVEELAGFGVSAYINGKKILAGNKRLMEKEGIKTAEINHIGTAVYVACDGVYMGCIVIADRIKKEAEKAINELKNAGIFKTVMLTGDKKAVADVIADKIGISEVYSELLPADKVGCIENIIKSGKKGEKVVFVGDGINDAPVLTRADIGISMGSIGSDAAIEASDVVLMDDNPLKIALAIRLSKKTKRIVIENIVFALFIKFAVLILGAMGYANMWTAAFADVGVSVIAILNAMRMFL